jgi:basic amino acid/polyamine antiporter, APA family
VRAVTRWEIVGLAVNNVVGSGIYLLPATAAALLGTASIGAVLLAGGAVALLALCFAEASTHFDEAGGAYLYAREAFGPFVGFEVGWMTWVARVAAVASLSNGVALATAYFWPAARGGWARAVVIVVPLLVLTWVNVVGVKAGARTAAGFAIAKVLPLLLFVCAGVFFLQPAGLSVAQLPQAGALGRAALLLLFAYAGFENTPAAAGEFRDPRRDVPFALIVTVVLTTLLYTAVQVVALGTLPGLATSGSPLAAAAGLFLGGWGALVLTLGAVIGIAGTIHNTMLTGPRYLFAMADDGFGPRILAHVHPKHRTPDVAIGIQSALSLALALSGSFAQLALLSVLARLVTYTGTAAAVPVLRRRFARHGGFRLPGGAAIPVAATLVSLGFAGTAGAANLVAGGAGLAAGAALYFVRRRPDPGANRVAP